jgi:hypothetical protein
MRSLPDRRWVLFYVKYTLGYTAVFGRTQDLTGLSADNNKRALDGFANGGIRCEMARH